MAEDKYIECLKSLRAEGYFVSLQQKEDDTIIQCKIYITDHDDETGTTNILEIHDALRDETQNCLGCRASPGEIRGYTRGSVLCPLLCGSYTKSYALTEKTYRGKLGSKITNMPSEMASKIYDALK